MDAAFIRKGKGYADCTAFDGLQIIANPMGGNSAADRAGRCGGPFKCDYQSHVIQLARDSFGKGLYILMQNGSGREVLRLPSFYDFGALEAHILALPEPLQYGLLYTIWQTATNARQEALQSESRKWSQAFADGHLKKRRGTTRRPAAVEIRTPTTCEGPFYVRQGAGQ